jgi:hypothetical protein
MKKLINTKGEVVLKSGVDGREKFLAYQMAVGMLKTTGKRKAIVKTLSNIILI